MLPSSKHLTNSPGLGHYPNSDVGDVMLACGIRRKIRIADASRGKGKHGGARVIYLHVPEAKRLDIIDVYGKDEKDDLSEAEKKQFRQLTVAVKTEAVTAYKNWLQENGS